MFHAILLLQAVGAETVELDGPGPWTELRPWEDSSTRVHTAKSVPRFDGPYDRLYSRWNGRWAVDGEGARRPATRKGLAGVDWRPGLMKDVEELGVTSVTVNVFLGGGLEGVEKVLDWAAERKILVSAILLAPLKHKTLSHPDAKEGHYALANVRSPEGFQALVDVVRRLGRRVAHWIVGNEVDSAWIWTNAGEKSAADYMEEYLRVLRVVHLAARSADPTSRAFISLTHHWNESHRPKDPRFYKGRELLEILEARGGDFEWGVAFHPYPENLFNPKSWEDKTAVEGFDTPRITFRNLHVLDAWMKRDAARYRGKVRGVLLSEQGFHTPGGEEGERLQAAALVYAWRQSRLDSIEAFQYHRWIDHEKEGGLRLGLWTCAKGRICEAERAKPIHAVLKALGTEREEEESAFALPIIGR